MAETFLQRIRSLFGQRQRPAQPPAGTRPASAAAEDLAVLAGWDVGLATDVGCARQSNQDCVAALRLELQQGPAQHALALALADGMGGHEAGDVASRVAVRAALAHLLTEAMLPLLTPDEGAAPMALRELLENAAHHADAAVRQVVKSGGTTLTLGLLVGQQLYLAHVGDSRAYLLQGGEARQLTRDHSFVGRLVELGELPAAEAGQHPQRNVLYRALGQGPLPEVDFATCAVDDAALMLCSDGLWSLFSADELAALGEEPGAAQTVCQRWIAAARQRHADDNVSLLLARPTLRGRSSP
ncbi:MAG: serine/threonine-protein phosphatase [Chloroflexi bacterium]|nr:serine/threonine-protein phosphatase [Chloroflexota bacterium]